jgi:hypothetical protein
VRLGRCGLALLLVRFLVGLGLACAFTSSPRTWSS